MVKRYVTTCDCVSQAEWGDYVRYDDYAALEAENAKLRAELERRAVPDAHAFKDELLKATKWFMHPHIEGVFAVFMQQYAAPSAPKADDPVQFGSLTGEYHADVNRLMDVNRQLLDALGDIAWSNNSQWQADRARAARDAARQEGGKV